ncbi:MAG: class I SAM-dependent methyltransferase [Saprospiraceae bacterium]|nr:class I SAM-dependent methyltransferase [Saprospiraceae bacterium]
MNKSAISNFLRYFGFIFYLDQLRYYLEKVKNLESNRDFTKNHPNIVLPDDYLMYESFQLNYRKYYFEGMESAKWLIQLLEAHVDLKNKKILDWGCGPGRIIRHLPELTHRQCEYYATDYNKNSIEWCSQNLPYISFNCNTIHANLPYLDDSMDIIYGISIITHLSEKSHYSWYRELFRILKPGGILLLTTQGDNFCVKLSDLETANFREGKLVIRGKVKEGHRTYSAFHPPEFMKTLLSNGIILEHKVYKPELGKSLPQDVWIIKKPC